MENSETPIRTGTVRVPVVDLMLDPENPRLPEEAEEWSLSDLVIFFRKEYAIDEIIDSMLKNGYFEQEPLIILAEPDPVENQYIVVEGSRRLSSLMYIHGAVDDDYFDEPPTEEQLSRLEDIPCVMVESREEVRTYLGFRHIGGIKDWSPEAKARFISLDVERLAASGDVTPFRTTGKAYGSNTQGIRNAYISLKILRHAKREFGIDISYVQHQRFGVWHRCLNSQGIKHYIGFGNPKNFEDIQSSLDNLKEEPLRNVINDLTPQKPNTRALLSDSRDVTNYGKVLTNKKAIEVLRTYGELDAAVQVIRTEDLPGRIESLAIRVESIVDEVIDAAYSQTLHDATLRLYRESRKIYNELNAKEEELL